MSLLIDWIHYCLGHVWAYKLNKNNKPTARRCGCGIHEHRVSGARVPTK